MAEYRDHLDQASFEQIENYLLGRMDLPAQQAFEQAMAADEGLRNEVELQRKLIATVEVGAFLVSKSAVGAGPAPQIIRRWYYVAAAVLIIAAGLTWMLRQPSASDDLFARYFHTDPGLPVVMSSTHNYAFYDGMVSYKEGFYGEAAGKWELLGRQSGYSDTLQYYIGVALLNNEQVAESRTYLQPVAEDGNSIWKEKATWYLALSYIRSRDYARAVRWLTLLTNNDRAKQLLAEPALQKAR